MPKRTDESRRASLARSAAHKLDRGDSAPDVEQWLCDRGLTGAEAAELVDRLLAEGLDKPSKFEMPRERRRPILGLVLLLAGLPVFAGGVWMMFGRGRAGLGIGLGICCVGFLLIGAGLTGLVPEVWARRE